MDLMKAIEQLGKSEVRTENGITRMKADIHVPLEVHIISQILKRSDPDTEIYMVGGAIRDYLFHKFHSDQSKPYTIKDIDLATNLEEEDIICRLTSEEAQRFYVKVKEKESVDTFGVVFVNVGRKGPFEVAPFRKDIGITDGRRPDHVERGTILEDAMRRDLTINNLYYDFVNKEILDFNPNGQGIEDIKRKVVRTVGDPFDRFNEDKLRILRLVRFFSRYNDGLASEHLSLRTLDAIEHFKQLAAYKGMSAERIQTEFMMGLAQSLNTANYLKNYADLDLFGAVFGHALVDLDAIRKIDNLKNARVVLAMLLHKNENVWKILNELKYPNEISDPVEFLCQAMIFEPEKNAVDVLKARDRRLIKIGKKKTKLEPKEIEHNNQAKEEMSQDIKELCWTLGDLWRAGIMEHMANFSVVVPSGEHFIQQGLSGIQIGTAQREYLQLEYEKSLKSHLSILAFQLESH